MSGQTLTVADEFRYDSESLAADPYVRLVRQHLLDPKLFTEGPEGALRRQRELLLPFLEFFLRHDNDGFYHALYRRKALLDDGGGVRGDVALEDLAVLRIHSDDLRGNGQRRRLIRGVAAEARCKVFTSSGTSGHAEGPVTIARSPLTLHFMHHAMGRQFEWGAGHTFDGSYALMQATPQMRQTVGLPNVVSDAFETCGAEVVLGARLREDAGDVPVWRRIEPDIEEMRRFFSSSAEGRIALIPPPALAQLISDEELVRRISPQGEAYLDMGEGGVLMCGGGLKKLMGYETLRDLMIAAQRVFRARRDGQLVPAPILDVLGLVESASGFPARAGDPREDATWVKCPHPLTWVGTFESAQRLELAPVDEFGEPRLLFYVSFMCVDYLEAVVSGDVVVRQHTPELPQHGFVYVRRAAEEEGFKIREGCG